MKALLGLTCVVLVLSGCGGGDGSAAATAPMQEQVDQAPPAAAPPPSIASIIASVRAMAGPDNVPFPGTPLAEEAAGRGRTQVTCSDYAFTAQSLLAAAGYSVHVEQTCLVPNAYDCHTLVSIENSPGRFELADPTFGLIMHGTPEGNGITLEEMRDATRTLNFTAVRYEFVAPEADGWVRNYYLDYPLLFANVYSGGSPTQPLEAQLIDKYYVPLGAAYSAGYYAVACAPGQSAAAVIVDGAAQSWPCEDNYGLTWVHRVESSLASSDGSVVLQPQRFVF